MFIIKYFTKLSNFPRISYVLKKKSLMTLSILIPTYRYDCSQLVLDLHRLAEKEQLECEILVCDDASGDEMLAEKLIALEQHPSVRVFLQKKNLGRARVRNFLASQAAGRFVLFIDSDAAVPSSFSLRRYVEAAAQAPVVCGGLRHPEVNPCPEASLRYRYERNADPQRAAVLRNAAPYARISTFSLLADREVFLSVQFDPSCTEYGHEDTLFGAELQRRNIPILHIDNALIHMGLEPNDVFLKKTETALGALRRLEPQLRGHSPLLAMADRLRKWHLTWAVRCVYKMFRPLLRRNLLGSRPSLLLFKFYKLGFFYEVRGKK